jgi:SAM-dependent methyltransferase
LSACRGCGAPLDAVFCDLRMTPLANSYVPLEARDSAEPFLPLRAMVCERCFLVQLPEIATPETIFSHYAYLSSVSTSWVEHARRFATRTIDRRSLDGDDLVVELASNDGYLLRWFADAGIPVLGIEPAANVAAVAEQNGVQTMVEFFGAQLAAGIAATKRASVIVANNVLAHVPDLHDFVEGIARLLASDGIASIEFPHLLRLMEQAQFDTIYHEHFSYFSLLALEPVLTAHGLTMVDVEALTTHGGSLRLTLAHVDARDGHDASGKARVDAVVAAERAAGLDSIDAYRSFGALVERRKRDILRFLFDRRDAGDRIVGYGAPAKGNTMLNYCGIGTDLIEFTVDANPLKQGTLLPGSRIPVLAPSAIDDAKPDIVVILPWNISDEIAAQLAGVAAWGGRLAVCQPEPRLLP